jgi:two-component system sensor histidine kinase UhpB
MLSEDAMSLRGQVLLSVVLALLLGFAVETAIACRQAESSVKNEMQRALATGAGIVSDAVASLPEDGRDAYLERLVRGFDGDRHITVNLMESGRVAAHSRPAPPESVPAWFVGLLAIPRQSLGRPLPDGGMVTVTTDPRNEISESWNQLRDGVLALLVFCGLVLIMLAAIMAQSVHPLNRLSAGFEALGSGNYAARVDVHGPRELSRMTAAFNRMAERLGLLETSNRRLAGQMLAIQEEERADLARDLHDEMAPLLFSVRMGAAAIAAESDNAGLTGRARAIEEAATRMQLYVREMLKQLRPDDGLDLAQSIENLALFWQRQRGDVVITLTMPPESSFGIERDAVLFRLVQEGVTNAVRHGGAKTIAITIAKERDRLVARIEDDGSGLANTFCEGMGLKGMRERLSVFSGGLSLTPRPGGGVCLSAEMLCSAEMWETA